MVRLIASLSFVLLLLTTATAIEEVSATFEETDCFFPVPSGYDVDCGFVKVPESRNPELADNTNGIRIAVARISSFSDNPQPDPVIYLEGGPGAESLIFGEFYTQDFSVFLEERDVILFDQRGIGFSEPALDCPELTELDYELLDDDISAEEATDLYFEVANRCRERFIDQGANLVAYNSAENAADVADIIEALDYEQVNLFGISYGTKLGLTIMRDHPGIVRSAILDSVYPPEVDGDELLAINADRAFDTLFAGCAASPACDERFPALETVFYETVDRLNENPELVTFFDFYTETERDILVSGDALVSILFGLMYATVEIPQLPEYIYAASEGNYDAFLDDAMFSLFYDQFFSIGAYYSYECYEESSFSDPAEVEATLDLVPPPVFTVFSDGFEEYQDFCANWTGGMRASDVENQPVVSDIPTLVIAGEYDPITPPAFAEMVAENLSNSYYYEFPGVGHSAWYGAECAQNIGLQFVADPTSEPDASCLAEVGAPVFVRPPVEDVTLMEFSDDELGFSAVAPVGWELVDAVVFALNPNTGLPALAYRFPDSIDAYVEQIIFGPAYEYTELPEPRESVEANGLTWEIYAIQNETTFIYSLFAFTTAEDGTPYVIAVVTESEDERQALYEALFIPAIEGFTPLDN